MLCLCEWNDYICQIDCTGLHFPLVGRDKTSSQDPYVENRRAHFEEIFAILEKAGMIILCASILQVGQVERGSCSCRAWQNGQGGGDRGRECTTWTKKRPLRLCIKSEHCSYHGISKNQAWLRFGVQRCMKSRPVVPLCHSPDHAVIAW